jgi:hypothetical protein
MPAKGTPTTGDPRLSSPARRRLVAAIRDAALSMAIPPPCGYCHKPIHWYAKAGPWRYVLDEWPTPRHLGGDPTDPSNVRPAHHRCNASAGAAVTNAKRWGNRSLTRPTNPPVTSRNW